MFKTIATWFTLAVLLLSLAAPTLVIVAFELERGRIAQEECREREVKNSCCKGSCVLNERLQSIETNQDPTAPQSERVLPEIQLVFLERTTCVNFSESLAQSAHHLLRNTGEPMKGFAQVLLNPPRITTA